jgi:DNA helicase II / ATP-dependent DNA helicase PcrA
VDHLQGLNPEQKRAVEHRDGPLLILAGAGSGKTRVLTRRIAHLLANGVRPWQVLAVTFTNKAAAEMRHRVRELVGDAADDLWVSTFHSTCVRILRRDSEELGISRRFVIWDTDDQIRAIKRISADLRIDKKKFKPNALRGVIDRAKNKLWTPERLAEEEGIKPQQVELFRRYEATLKGSEALDFNDLVNKVVLLFQTRPEVLKRYQNKFRYLMVDEYQDTNLAQYELVKALGAAHQNVAVVGDDDQSIYSFRGADITNILNFEKDFADAVVVKLEQNYRSTGHILKAATAVVRNNRKRKAKTLWTDLGDGEKIRQIIGQDEEAEAEKVIAEVRGLIRKGRTAGDVAVIYRTNARSRPFEMALRRAGFPYQIVGARRFYERREVKDLLSYLKLVVNPVDEASFLRIINVPRRGLGPKAIAGIRVTAEQDGTGLLAAAKKLGAERRTKVQQGMAGFVETIEGAQANLTQGALPGELLMYLAEGSGYLEMVQADEDAEDRLRNIEELARDLASEEFTGPEDGDSTPMDAVARFLDRATLSGQDAEIPDGGAVTLLTAHLCKGLEFPVVFMAGLIEGSFPLLRDDFTEEALEEERRLAYVAITRAQQELILTRAMRRRTFDRGFQRATPSRFLDEIPRECFSGFSGKPKVRPVRSQVAAQQRLTDFMQRHALPTASNSEAPVEVDDGPIRTREPEHLGELVVGKKVHHPEFGVGQIRRRTGNPSNPLLTVAFGGFRSRNLLARTSGLEIVVE